MPDSFTAVTWNVLYSTPVAELAPVVARTRKRGASLYLVQEASADGLPEVFADHGLHTWLHHPQYLVAWDPSVWMPRTTWGERLAPTPFYRKGSRRPVYVEAAMAILCDEAGRTLTAMSYHTPSNVQVARPPSGRRTALEESARSWGDLARSAHTHGCLFGGDDNVDESGHFGPWDFLLRAGTGLRQVRAPHPTHGDRRIDDFRVRGITPGRGWTMATPGDHRLHGRTFHWG